MRIFGKHIFRSIKKEPVQPVMIILIVTFCVAVMLLSIALPVNIYMNEKKSLTVDQWTADITVSLKSTGGASLIFEEDIKSIVAGKARVIGEFSLTGFSALRGNGEEKTQVRLGAFNLVDADRFYEIKYTEYGKITNTNLSSATIVGEGFAKEYGLDVGDTVTLNILGRKFTYVVQAVAKDRGIFKTTNMIVDISSVRKTLAERSPIIASLSSDFNPYTKIHLKVNEGVNAEELKAELEALDSFEDKKLELMSDQAKINPITTVIITTIVLPASLLLIVAAMMMISTLELLEKKRQSDIALFKMAGADVRQLSRILYLESAFYGVVGGILGSLLSIPATSWLNSLYGFKFSKMSFGIGELLIGLGTSLAFTSISTYVHLRKQKKRKEAELLNEKLDTGGRFIQKVLPYLLLIALLTAITLILPPKHRYVSASLLLLAVVMLIYITSSYVIKWFALFVSYLASKKRSGGKILLAARSCVNSYPLKHAGRIMTILITIFMSLAFVLSVVENQLVVYTEYATFDYIGMRVNDKTKKQIRELDGVVATAESKINRNVVIEDLKSITGVTVTGDVENCFKDSIMPKTFPSGDSIALSSGVAKMLGIKVGDRVKCIIEDIPCEFTLTEIVESHADFAFYDAEYVGSGFDMYCILTDGTDEVREELAALCDEKSIEFLPRDSFFSVTYNRLNPQLSVFRVMFAIMILMTAIGILNVLTEQRIERRRDFEMVIQNGATRKNVVALQATELLCLFACALLVSAVCSVIICRIIDTAAISFGLTLFL